MSDSVATTLAIVVLLLCGSMFFSGTEVAMFGLRRVDRQLMARSSRRADSLVLAMLARPRRLIATILMGNESINISMSAVMAGLCERMFPHRSETELALIATAMALPLLLLIGEITPKTVAFKHPMPWSRAAVRPLFLFGLITTPIRLVLSTVASLIMRPFGGRGQKVAPRDLSEAEFKALVDAGSAEGEVDARERRLIHRVFEFGDKTVAEAMVPRSRVFALSYDLPAARLTQEIAARGYSRVPIYQRSLDNIRGFLHAKDLLIHGATAGAAPRKLSELLHEPLFIPQTAPLERVFRLFKQRKMHMAVVVNEYGKVSGLLTLEDLLEQLFGEIRDEREQQKLRAHPRAATPPPVAIKDGGAP